MRAVVRGLPDRRGRFERLSCLRGFVLPLRPTRHLRKFVPAKRRSIKETGGGKKKDGPKVYELACVMGGVRWFHLQRALMAPPVGIYEWLTRSRMINKSMQRIIRRGSRCQAAVINAASCTRPKVFVLRVSLQRGGSFYAYTNAARNLPSEVNRNFIRKKWFLTLQRDQFQGWDRIWRISFSIFVLFKGTK